MCAAGPAGVHSVPAGVIFGFTLLALAASCGLQRPTLTARHLLIGLAGSVVVCLPAALQHIGVGAAAPMIGQFPQWAAVVTLVAVAEELLLRGALFESVARWRGEYAAIAVTAAAFGFIHVPFYGWTVLPVDLAVGVFLGALRTVSRSLTAPLVTHMLADLAGWWLR
jgi:membrane protease YdiL (CAAX protease family)